LKENKMGGVVKAITGGGGSPKVSAAPAAATAEEQRKAKTSRAALYETGGGVTGAELNPDQVKRRNTLLGN
jgi:hypothetical protein